MTSTRSARYRQAAWVYLHVGVLYEATVWALASQGMIPTTRGPVWVWLLFGAAIVAVVFWGLHGWQNRWFARAVWALHSLRLPFLIEHTFVAAPDQAVPPALYGAAIPVVLVNLWMLARAGWDL